MSIVSEVLHIVGSLADKFSIVEKDKFMLELQKEIDDANLASMQVQANISETQVQQVNAATLFFAGWRPALGWLGVFAIAYNTIFLSLVKTIFAILAAMGISPDSLHNAVSFIPDINLMLLGNIVLQMLGMAGLRTLEKIHGVSRDSLASTETD